MVTWSRRRTILAVGVAAVVLWMLWCAWIFFGAAGDLRDGGDALRSVRREATIGGLVDDATRDELEQARGSFDDAAAGLGSPVLAPMRLVPVVGRHVRAADRLAEAGAEGSSVALDVLDDLDALIAQPHGTGPERLAVLEAMASAADDARQGLASIEVGERGTLVEPLGSAVEEVGAQREEAERAADRMASASRALAGVLAGPRPYLLLGSNNAEMRAGSGMFLSAAELGFDEGSLVLGDVRATEELVQGEGTVAVDPQLAANWPWIDVGRDLRNLGLTADFPQSAVVAVANWERVAPSTRLEGVIAIDVDGLRGLLRVVGPVEVDGVRYDVDTVRGELLRDQYRRFDDREERRDQLGAVARAVFARIEAGDWELDALAQELADAVAGRHLMVWSADPEVQDVWTQLGAAGDLDEDSVSVALLNRSGAKIDSWIASSVQLQVDAVEEGGGRLTVTATFANEAPGEGPAYLVGPNVAGLAAGDHRGIVVVNLPAGVEGVEMDGARLFLEGGDGPTSVVAGELDLLRGEEATVTVTAELPAGVDRLTVEPTARVPRTRWEVQGETLDRDRRRTVDLAKTN